MAAAGALGSHPCSTGGKVGLVATRRTGNLSGARVIAGRALGRGHGKLAALYGDLKRPNKYYDWAIGSVNALW